MNFAAAAGTPTNTVIHTDSKGLDAADITIDLGAESLPAYFAAPAGKTGMPVILVVQEIFGVHEHIKDVCRRLAHEGYLAIAPELYFRQGDASAYDDIQTLFSELVNHVPDAGVMADLDAAVGWAAGHGGDTSRLGVIGFCWGGRITWLYAAHSAQIKAGVAWYGKLQGPHDELKPQHPVDVAGQLRAPVLGLYGGQDTGIPLDAVQAMQGALSAGGPASKASEFVVYDDAPHAFLADYRPSYRPEAARDGWQRMLAWFDRFLNEQGAGKQPS
nr:dienelactone hydrolase family protein [Pseudomonas sp.]